MSAFQREGYSKSLKDSLLFMANPSMWESGNGTHYGLCQNGGNGLLNGCHDLQNNCLELLMKRYLNLLHNSYQNGRDHHFQNGYQNGCNGILQNGSTPKTAGSGTPAETEDQETEEAARTKPGFSFLSEVFQLLMKEAIEEGTKVTNKVLEFRHPEELKKELDMSLSSSPAGDDELLDACRQIIKYSVKTGHPHFFNQLFGGQNLYALAGCFMTETLNTSQYTYEVAPVFTLMEKVVLDEMMTYIGFKDGDAIFCPGGSVSNMYAINVARYHRFPEVKRKGAAGLPTMCVLTSEKCHYSIKKGAAMLGVGEENMIGVKSDAAGRMIPEALEQAILELEAEGKMPIMVNATAGTTVLGAYDPIDAIAEVCERHKVWLHVDGAWGGAVLLSEKLRHKMKGIERADSMTWNAHKMMGVPQQASAFFTKHKTILAECHSACANYLFQQDKFYDVSYDTGDKSIQCGRKVDVLKLWMMWKAKGTEQMAAGIENIFYCADYLAKNIRNTEGFRIIIDEPDCTNVCFWYIPPSMRGQPETPQWWERLSKVAPVIKRRMMEQGTMLVGYQPDDNFVNFFRMVVTNTAATTEDMDFVVNEIARLGEDL